MAALDRSDGPGAPAPARVALVTTLLLPAGGGGVAASFVAWHLHLGFERLYLYFDDGARGGDPVGWSDVARYVVTGRVVAVRRGADLLARQRSRCGGWVRFGAHAAAEVQARQCLNAEDAAIDARCAGLRWLVHVDIDELFYAASPAALAGHFAALDADGVGHCCYANHEGVAEGGPESGYTDYFQTITLFKTHHLRVPLSPKAADAMAAWRAASRRGQYLLCYDNGKSAVRLVRGAKPRSVHAWSVPDAANLRRRTALADARCLDAENVAREPEAMPSILHFVACSRFWLRKKYEILGAFPDAWFGGTLPIAPSFHLDARDAVRTGDGAALDAFYDSHLAPFDAETLADHVACGVLRRVAGPATFLNGGLSPPPPPPRAPPPRAPPPEAPGGFSSEKAWILGAAAARFL